MNVLCHDEVVIQIHFHLDRPGRIVDLDGASQRGKHIIADLMLIQCRLATVILGRDDLQGRPGVLVGRDVAGFDRAIDIRLDAFGVDAVPLVIGGRADRFRVMDNVPALPEEDSDDSFFPRLIVISTEVPLSTSVP